MAWLKEYGLSVAGVIASGYLAAHAGFNLGVEAQDGTQVLAEKPAAVAAAKPSPATGPQDY